MKTPSIHPKPSAPRIWIIALLGGFATCAFGSSQQACTPGQRQDARTALDVSQIACIIANQTLDDARVPEVCNLVDALVDPMKRVLASARAETGKQVAAARVQEKAAGANCPKGDGGALR